MGKGERRRRQTGRKERGSFVALPHEILNHANFVAMKPRAVKLLLDLLSQFKGANNGDLAMAWKSMAARGWTSRDQLAKARRELLERGWIVTTRAGRIPNVCALYAVTWLPIDECGGKLDRQPTHRALGRWRSETPAGSATDSRI